MLALMSFSTKHAPNVADIPWGWYGDAGDVTVTLMLTSTIRLCFVGDVPCDSKVGTQVLDRHWRSLKEYLPRNFGDQIKGWMCESKPLPTYLQLAIQMQQGQRPLDSSSGCLEAYLGKISLKEPAPLSGALLPCLSILLSVDLSTYVTTYLSVYQSLYLSSPDLPDYLSVLLSV